MSFKTEQNAQDKCDEVLAILGSNWKGRVWNNLGWHCAWRWGSVMLYYSVHGGYTTLIGSPGEWSGHADLSSDIEACADPKEAVQLACDAALEVIEREWEPIKVSILEVRANL